MWFLKFFKIQATKLFIRQFRSIANAALVISIMTLISRLLGLVRDHFLAYKFGAGEVLDMYYAAFRAPDFLYNLLVLGALSAGFIPVFTSYLQVQDKNQEITPTKDAWVLFNNILNFLIIIILFFSIVGIILTPFFIKFLVPGFSKEQLIITTHLTQLMFLSPIFLSISSLFGGVLQSFKRFLVYSLAPIMYNIGIIIGVLVFYDFLGIYGLGLGVVLGAFLHMIIQIPPVFHLGYKYRFLLDTTNKGLHKMFFIMIPRVLSLAVSQVNLIIITIIASTLYKGSLAVFNFANNLQGVPIGLFGVSFAIACFPSLSFYASKKNWKSFSKTFSNVFRQILFLVIPISVLYIIFRAQIVRLVLGSGNFDWNDTIRTFNALGIFAVSLFAQSLIPLMVRSFYSLHDSKTPFFIGVISVSINTFLSIILSKYFDILGLVSAFTITSIIQFFLLLVLLFYKIRYIQIFDIIISFIKILFASIILGIFSQGFKYLLGLYFNIDTFIGIFMQTFISMSLGLLVFIIISFYLKIPEIIILSKVISRKLLKQIDIPQDKIE